MTDAFTPQQTIELVSRTGAKKAHMRLDKLFINSCMAGPLLGFGCAVLVSVNASPWYQDNAPGLIRLFGALLFPVGLVMIVISGADLFTTNIMFMTTAFLTKRVNWKQVLVSWVVSWLGNLAGMLFFVTIICGYGGVFEETPAYRTAAINIATQKAVNPKWHQIFLRAIGANWLVCFAVFSSIQGRDLTSKIIAIWWPTATFVALALDHVVANMFFIPMAIFLDAPGISVGFYIWKSLIPTTLGNMVGGGLFIGTAYWFLYLTGEAGVRIQFDLGGIDSATEGGAGPLKIEGRDPREFEGNVSTDGAGGDTQPGTAGLVRRPGTGGSGKTGGSGNAHGMGGWLTDLRDDGPYAKSWKEREAEEEREGSGRNGRAMNGDEKV